MVYYRKATGLTIKKAITFEGIAPHFNKISKILIEPASGFSLEYKNQRVNFNPMDVEVANSHITAIKVGSEKVLAIEHLLSVLHCLRLRDVCIELSGCPEIPVRDACAESYLKLFKKDNLIKTHGFVLEVKDQFKVKGDFGEWAKISPPAGKSPRIKLTIDFPNFLGRQTITTKITTKAFRRKIAPARTFLRSPYSKEQWGRIRTKMPILPKDIKRSPIIAFTEDKYITPLKFEHEPAYHKLLDLMGDLYTIGVPLLADIEIYKPGHKFNQKIARVIYPAIKKQKEI